MGSRNTSILTNFFWLQLPACFYSVRTTWIFCKFKSSMCQSVASRGDLVDCGLILMSATLCQIGMRCLATIRLQSLVLATVIHGLIMDLSWQTLLACTENQKCAWNGKLQNDQITCYYFVECSLVIVKCLLRILLITL